MGIVADPGNFRPSFIFHPHSQFFCTTCQHSEGAGEGQQCGAATKKLFDLFNIRPTCEFNSMRWEALPIVVFCVPPLLFTPRPYFFAPHVSSVKEQGMGINAACQLKNGWTHFNKRPRCEFNSMRWEVLPTVVFFVPALFSTSTDDSNTPHACTVKEQGKGNNEARQCTEKWTYFNLSLRRKHNKL